MARHKQSHLAMPYSFGISNHQQGNDYATGLSRVFQVGRTAKQDHRDDMAQSTRHLLTMYTYLISESHDDVA